MAKSKTSKGGTAVEEVDPVELMRSQIRQEQAENLDRESEALNAYLRLIARETLSPDEAKELASAARDLGYDPDQLTTDRKIISQAKEYRSQFDSLATLHQKMQDARAAYQSFLERVDLEEQTLADRRDYAERQHRLAVSVGRGGGKLEELANERPELFDRDVHPPRLRVG